MRLGQVRRAPATRCAAASGSTSSRRAPVFVQTAGALVTVIGGALASATAHRRVTPEVHVVYVARRRISPTHLLDAALEAACSSPSRGLRGGQASGVPPVTASVSPAT
jgi:hypothetical protein